MEFNLDGWNWNFHGVHFSNITQLALKLQRSPTFIHVFFFVRFQISGDKS